LHRTGRASGLKLGVKLMVDNEHFLSIWVGQRSTGLNLTLRSGAWKRDSVEKQSSEIVVDLMVRYLHNDLSKLNELEWTRPVDKVFLDNIMELKKSKNYQLSVMN